MRERDEKKEYNLKKNFWGYVDSSAALLWKKKGNWITHQMFVSEMVCQNSRRRRRICSFITLVVVFHPWPNNNERWCTNKRGIYTHLNISTYYFHVEMYYTTIEMRSSMCKPVTVLYIKDARANSATAVESLRILFFIFSTCSTSFLNISSNSKIYTLNTGSCVGGDKIFRLLPSEKMLFTVIKRFANNQIENSLYDYIERGYTK